MEFDSLTVEILWRRLITVSEEMAATIVRTSFSNIVGSAADFSCEIVDSRGEGLAHSKSTVASFVYTMPNAVRALLKKFPKEMMCPGDVYVSNHPWLLSGHQGDVALITPVFKEDDVVAFACSIAHMSDIGGSIDRNRVQECYEEGLIIPLGYFYREGKINQFLVDLLKQNVRFADLVLGDIHALVSANKVGVRRILELMDQYELDELDSLSDAVLGRSEAAMRESIALIPDGEYISELIFDELDKPLFMRCRIIIDGDSMTVDYTGTSPQHDRGGINATKIYTQSHTAYSLHCILLPDVYSNGGCYRPINYTIPEGCILNARFPASVWMRTSTGWYIHGAVHTALSKALPERVLSSTGLTSAGSVYVRENGRASTSWFYVGGGMGATYKNDGISGMLFPTGVMNISIEQFELAVPILIQEKGIRQDSGGPGRFRGGCGTYATYESHPSFEGNALLSGTLSRKNVDPPGIRSGSEGKAALMSQNGRPLTREEVVRDAGAFPLHEGPLTWEAAGAGGYGPPWERDVNLVLEDVEAGYVSIESAQKDYGVVLDPDTLEINEELTKQARISLKQTNETTRIGKNTK